VKHEGIVDFHVHSAPSLLPRHTWDPETSAACVRAGVSRFVLKAHEGSSAERAALLGALAVGGVVLNSSVGGANPDAVATAARMGARVVWLPTLSSPAHQAAATSRELNVHRGNAMSPVPVVDAGRELRSEWYPVLEVIAEHDLILGSGHVLLDEALVVFRAAHALGARRFLVNHPLLPFLEWRSEHPAALQALECRLEVGPVADLIAEGEVAATPRLVETYPSELLVFGSDLGHTQFPTYEEGVASWLQSAIRHFEEDQLHRIMTANGEALLA
jgi:hypothetical protein